MDTSDVIQGVRGDEPARDRITGPSGLTPLMDTRMVERALRKGWIDPDANWTAQERRDVIGHMLEVVRTNRDVRSMTAAARVLATLERNVIAADRNVIQEQGQELGAATDRLRATLGSPAALSAMAALSAAVTQTTQPQVPTEVVAPGVAAIEDSNKTVHGRGD